MRRCMAKIELILIEQLQKTQIELLDYDVYFSYNLYFVFLPHAAAQLLGGYTSVKHPPF